jgi:RNA polymerase sigma-70 factor (ECF subfamily)
MDTSGSLLKCLAGAPTDDDWRRFDDLYRPLLRAWMARAEVPASDFDDLVQEVLLVVFREIADFEWRGKGAFRAWLRTILARRLRKYFAKRIRLIAIGGSDFQRMLNELESHDSDLSRLWDREHDQHVVASLMKRVQHDFDPVWWQAYQRYALGGEPAGQVAEALGMSLNSVLLAKSRVLKRLRQEAAGLVD